MKIPFDLHFSTNYRKRFYVDQDYTLAQIETHLKKEDKTIQSVEFRDREKLVENKTANFIKNVIHNNVKIEINRKIVPITTDLNDAAAYDNDSKYDVLLHDYEIPINDASLLTNFISVFNENLERNNQNKQLFAPNQIIEALELSIKNFKNKNEAKINSLEMSIDILSHEKSIEEAIHQKLVDNIKKQASNGVKWAIRISVFQLILLFYLTYYVYGWDITEPISYLISLFMETMAIYFFLRYTRNLEQRNIFTMALQKYKPQMLTQKSTHPMCQLDFLNKRINYLNQKILYNKSI